MDSPFSITHEESYPSNERLEKKQISVCWDDPVKIQTHGAVECKLIIKHSFSMEEQITRIFDTYQHYTFLCEHRWSICH